MNPFLETASTPLKTAVGLFRLHGFKDSRTGLEHAAMAVGDLSSPDPVLARLHSECLTGDAFHSLHCDCGRQLDSALSLIAAEGRGVLLYLRQEGRGIGLLNKIRAYELQRAGADTVDANRLLGLPDDARDYGIAAEIFTELGVASVRLLTNNPAKMAGLVAHGIEVAERVATDLARTEHNSAYLDTKAGRMGHVFEPLPAPGHAGFTPQASPPPHAPAVSPKR